MIFKSLFNKSTDNSPVEPKVVIKSASFDDRIANLIDAGFSAKCIFDCGASVGQWSYKISKLFPGAQIIAIEPNSEVLPQTEEILARVKPKVIIEDCALADKQGETRLNIFWNEDHTKMSASSLKDHVQGKAETRLKVRLDTLDNLCERHKLIPDLVKLDLQGGELDALKGATSILASTEVIISEFGCLPAYINRTTPLDLMEIMYNNNYCLYDIIDLLYRPYDNALAGGDFIFVKNDSKLKKHKGYK